CGLFLDAYAATQDLTQALKQTLTVMLDLATEYQTDFSANFVITDGATLIASRFANRDPVPSLYWLQGDPSLPSSILIASEPFFEGNWQPFAERSLLTVSHDLTVQTESLESWYQP
ncbi:MAG: class II glutamine amidotransferase, partial [Alkalinema sp. RL_2_19]|nr:class II glutamine amidotransferase [Alkalinema sp. RL_2_19]